MVHPALLSQPIVDFIIATTLCFLSGKWTIWIALLLEVNSLLLCYSKVDSNPPYSENCFFMRKHTALIESGTDSEIMSQGVAGHVSSHACIMNISMIELLIAI